MKNLYFKLYEYLRFLRVYGRGKVFEKWPDGAVLRSLIQASNEGTLAAVTDGNELYAVCVAQKCEEAKSLHIIGWAVRSRDARNALLNIFERNFKGWTLTGTRHGKKVTFHNTPKLVRRLRHGR